MQKTYRSNTGEGDRGVGCQVLDCTFHVSGDAIEVHRHHQLFSLVRFGRFLAVIKIWSEGYETLIRETLDNVFDVGIKSPPLLDNHDRGASR